MRSDFYVGMGTTAFSAVALMSLYRSKASAFGISDLDSNAFPKIVAWALLGIGILLTIREIVRRRVKLPQVDLQQMFSQYQKPIGVLLLFFGYVLLLGKVGFFLTTSIFVLASSFFIGGRDKPLRAILITAAAVIVLYAVFRLWLEQILPGGWLI